MDRVEDVLIHQKLLALAKDPEKRPVYHIRFLEVLPNTSDSVFMFAILLSARCFLISGAKPSISLCPVMKNQVFGLSIY